MPAEAHKVGPHSRPFYVVVVFAEAVPGDAPVARLEEVVLQQASVRRSLFKARGAEAAVPSDKGGYALFEEGGNELRGVGRNKEPVVVGVHVDKAGGYYPAPTVYGLAIRLDLSMSDLSDSFSVH